MLFASITCNNVCAGNDHERVTKVLCRFMHAEDEDEQASATELPQLHITLTPQGSSAITMLLEPISNDSSPRQPADAIQQQFQQQLRKAQETLLPEFNIHHTIRPQVLLCGLLSARLDQMRASGETPWC